MSWKIRAAALATCLALAPSAAFSQQQGHIAAPQQTTTPTASAPADHPRFTPGSAGLGDSYFPRDGNGGYDVKHYGLKLRYQPKTDKLYGVATIKARATKNLSAFNLDFDGLHVRSVRVNGRAAKWNRAGGELTITPRHGLKKGKKFTAVIRYDGKPKLSEDSALGDSGFLTTDDGAIVAGEPHGASNWYPVNDHPLDKASYTFRIAAPKGLQVVANGVLKSRRTHQGFTTWVWQAKEPMASYLSTMAIGHFTTKSYRKNGIRFTDAIDSRLFDRPKPRTGSQFAISQAANQSYKRLRRTITVPANGNRLSFWVNRDTEAPFDFVFVEAHPVGSNAWTTLPDLNGHTSSETAANCPFVLELHPFLAHYVRDGGEDGCQPAGTTGTWNAASGASSRYEHWAVDLKAYAGRQVEVSISYVSDEYVQLPGVFVDDITVATGPGSTSFEADGNTLDGWTAPGAPAGSAPNANDWIAGPTSAGPPSTGDQARAALAREPEALKFLASLFGPYPYSAAGGVVDKVDLGFALETQTRPVYSPVFFSDVAEVNDSVIVHENAHQWVGDSLRVARWRHIWLNEGFATYAEWLWSEHQGRASAQEIFDSVASIPVDDDFWKVKIGDPGSAQLFDDPVYDRGAATLHALRLRVGDPTFFKILRTWTQSRAGDNVTTTQFIALAERLSGQDLDAFFNEWLFTEGRPASLPAPPAVSARSKAAAINLRQLQRPALRR